MEKEDGVLVVRRIHVVYRLEIEDQEHRAAAVRAHEAHAPFCPVYRTLSGCIDVTTELEVVATA